jgi:integrase
MGSVIVREWLMHSDSDPTHAHRHGLRASEVGMLQTDDLDLKQYCLRIQRLKRSLAGVHTLRPDEVKALKGYLKERQLRARAVSLAQCYAYQSPPTG